MKAAQTTVIRPASTVLNLIKFDDSNFSATLTKGSKVTLDELVNATTELSAQSASIGIRSANVLRLTRTLPEVTVTRGGGDKELRNETIPAFQRALELLKERCETESAFQNVASIVELLDIRDANNLTCSPFVVKEALGYLKKTGALNKTTLKLIEGDKVASALRDAKLAKVNAIRPVIQEAKAEKPDLYPKEAEKAAKAKGTTMTTPAQTPAPTTPAHTPTPEAPTAKDDASAIGRDLKSIRGRWEALMSATDTPDATRAALVRECQAELKVLAKLAGLAL